MLDVFRYTGLALAVVFMLHIVSTLISTGLEFDESFNLQVPLNLYLYGKYQTWYNGFHGFNYLITTGPTVAFPVYALFTATSSTGYMTARIVTFAYSVLLVWILYRELFKTDISVRGAAFGCAVLVMVFMVPEFAVMSIRVLGEIPGIALVAASYRLFASDSDTRVFGSGLLMALAVLSKLIFLMAVVPVVLVTALDSAASGKLRRGISRLGVFFAGIAIPLACWQLFKLSALGLSGYTGLWRMQRMFLESMTVGAPGNSLVDRAVSVMGGRVVELLAAIDMPGTIGYVFLALLAAAILLSLYAYVRNLRLDRFHVLVLLFGLVHTGWWAMLNIVGYYRHLFPGLVMLMAGTGLTLYGVYRSNTVLSKPAAALFTALFIVFTLSGLGRIYRGLPEAFTFTPSDEARAQMAYADKVGELAAKGYLFYGYEWLQVPELSYLAKVRFFSIYDKHSLSYLAKRPGILIVSRYNYEKNPVMSLDVLSRFTDIGPDNLSAAYFPEETPYIFAPITKAAGIRIAPAVPAPSGG